MSVSNEKPSKQHEKRFKCDTCGWKTTSKSNLHAHINGVHLKERTLKCDECDLTTAWPNQLYIHKKQHGQTEHNKLGTFKCNKCDHLSVSKNSLRSHMTKPHIKCEICSSLTTWPLRHMMKFHRPQKSTMPKKPNPRISESTPKRRERNTFKCDTCDYETTEKRYLANHARKVHLKVKKDEIYNCEKCDYITTSKDSYAMHMRTPHDKCEVCSLVATHFMLLRHKKKHGHGVKVYNCDTCRFKTTEKRNMDRHVRLVHKKDKYKCDKCDFITASRSSFYLHKKKDHIKCEICQFVTTGDKLFKRHMISWHSAKNLQTESHDTTSDDQKDAAEIPDSFKGFKSRLSGHDESTAGTCKEDSLKNKVDEVREEDYWTSKGKTCSCLACDFVGSLESDLSRPKVTHDEENGGIRCEKCPFISKSKGDLTHHMDAMHFHKPKLQTRKEKNYKCDICDYTTCHSTSLKKHKIDHITSMTDEGMIKITNTTSLQCEECPFIGGNSQGLSTHMKVAHGPKSTILPCTFCDFEARIKNTHANKYEEIVTHMKHNHPEEANLNKCDLCDHVSYNRKLIDNHRHILHLKESDRQCQICDFYSVFKKEMRHHKKDVHNVPYDYVCKICGQDFFNVSKLVGHEKKDHSSVILYNCVLCNYKAKSWLSVQKHSKVEHREDQVDKSCQFCDFEAQDVKMIEKHMSEVHEDQSTKSTCEKCNFFAYHEPILIEHKTFHEKMICTHCSFTGDSRRGLLIHIKMQHGRKQNQCTMCNFYASSNTKMRKHTKDAHGIPYDFACDICGKDYSNNSSLEKHMPTHSEVKGVKCNLCTFETKQNTSIRIHWKYVHKDVKIEIRCQYCDYEAPKLLELDTSFKHANTQLAVLEAHLKDVHMDIVKPSCCNKCQFIGYHGPTLTIHMKSLHELKCELCNYESESMKGLRIHIDTAHMRKKRSK